MSNPSKFLKVCLLGDGGVGKTSLCHRAVEGTFQENSDLTVAVNVFQYEIKTDHLWRLMLFDLGGQDSKDGPNADVFIRGASAVILVYDTSSILSFFSLSADWLPLIQRHVPRIPVIIVGTKYDIYPDAVEVPIDLVDSFIMEHAGQFNLVTPSLQISSKTGHNIWQMMKQVVESIALYRNLGISDVITY